MTTYRRNDAIAQVHGAGRVTLLLLREPGGVPVALTGSAVAVWEELGPRPRELGEIVSAVARRFQVTESLVESDVRGLCHQLVEAGLLVPLSADDQERCHA